MYCYYNNLLKSKIICFKYILGKQVKYMLWSMKTIYDYNVKYVKH